MRGFYGRLQTEEIKQITLDEGRGQFQTYNIAKNLSPQSIVYYNEHTALFVKFYGGDKMCDSITEHTVYEFIAYIRQHRNINDISVNTYLRAVRAMCYYFMKLGYTPPFQINLVKAEKQVKETYTDSEIKTLLEKPSISKTTFCEYRNWVMINYLLATGKLRL